LLQRAISLEGSRRCSSARSAAPKGTHRLVLYAIAIRRPGEVGWAGGSTLCVALMWLILDRRIARELERQAHSARPPAHPPAPDAVVAFFDLRRPAPSRLRPCSRAAREHVRQLHLRRAARQIYGITKSSAAVGMLGTQLVPLAVAALWAARSPMTGPALACCPSARR
jgi:hypothetical protein